MNQSDMNPICIDELSPISFGAFNVNNFVLTPNLLLHADDSVKSDDLDISLLACSSDDDSVVEITSPPLWSNPAHNDELKIGGHSAEGNQTSHVISASLGGSESYPHYQSTSLCERKTPIYSTQRKNECSSRLPSLEGRQFLHTVLPNSPLHEVQEFEEDETDQVEHDITVRNSSLLETFRCSVEGEAIFAACASLQNSLLQENSLQNSLLQENSLQNSLLQENSLQNSLLQENSLQNSLLQENSGSHAENEQGLDCTQLEASLAFENSMIGRYRAETCSCNRSSQVNGCPGTESSPCFCTVCNKVFHLSEAKEKPAPMIQSDSETESCTESFCSCKPRNRESFEEIVTEPCGFCTTQNKNKFAKTNLGSSKCDRPHNKENISETDIESNNSFRSGSKSSSAGSEKGCIVRPASKQNIVEVDAEVKDFYKSGNKENIEESATRPSHSYRHKEKESARELHPANCCIPEKGEKYQIKKCSQPVRSSTPLVRKQIYQKKRKKLVRQKRHVVESDSDSSEDYKRSPKKYKATSDRSRVSGFDSNSPLPLRRSLRVTRRRFALTIIDSESDSSAPARKEQRKLKKRLSSNLDCQSPVPPRKSERVSKKKLFSEYVRLSDGYDDDDDGGKISGVSKKEHVENQNDFCNSVTEAKSGTATIALKREVEDDGSQPSSPVFIPVAHIVYDQPAKKQSTPTNSQKNIHKPMAGLFDETKKNSSSDEHKSVPHQVKNDILSGEESLQTRAVPDKEDRTSVQDEERGTVEHVPPKITNMQEPPQQKWTKSGTSDSQCDHDRKRTGPAQSIKSQKYDSSIEGTPTGPFQRLAKLTDSAGEVLPEIKDTDRQASCNFETVVTHSTPKCGNNGSSHKRISKSKSRVSVLKKKGSKSKAIQKSDQADSTHVLSLKQKVTMSIQDSQDGNFISRAQFVFKVKMKEHVDPSYKQKLRKNGLLHSTDETNQKETCSKLENVGSKTEKKSYKTSDSEEKTCFKLQNKTNIPSRCTFSKTDQKHAACTKTQEEILGEEKGNEYQKEKKLSTRPGNTPKDQKVVSTAPYSSQSTVYSNRSTRKLTKDEVLDCSVDNKVLPQSLKIKTEFRGERNGQPEAEIANSDHIPNENTLLKQGTSKKSNRKCKKSEKDCKESYVSGRKAVKSKGHHNRNRGGEEKVYNFLTLAKAIGTEADAIQFCQQYGLLPQSSHCPVCGTLLSKLYKIVRTVNTSSVEFRFQCNRKICKSRGQIPVRGAHWFSKSTSIQCCQHLLIFYLFSNQFTTEQAEDESEVSSEGSPLDGKLCDKSQKAAQAEMVQDLYSFCREVCVLSLPAPEAIGGKNCTVVIIEAQFGKTKHCTPGFPEGQFVLGAFCRQTDVVFFIPVPALNSEHVIPVIERYVKKGSEVQTDNSHVYRKLGTLGYKHVALNHSQHELDFETGRCLKHNKDSIWWVRKESAPVVKKGSSTHISMDTEVLSSPTSLDTKRASSTSTNPGKKGSSASTGLKKKKSSSLSSSIEKKASSTATSWKKASSTSTSWKKASSTSTSWKKASSTATSWKKASSTSTSWKKASSTSTSWKKASSTATSWKKASSTSTSLEKKASLKKASSLSASQDAKRRKSEPSSSVSKCTYESVPHESQTPQLSTSAQGSTKQKSKASTSLSDAASTMDISHPSGISEISSESVMLGEAQSCSVHQVSGCRSSTSSGRSASSKSPSGTHDSYRAEKNPSADSAGTWCLASADVFLDGDSGVRVDEDSWLFALHMAEFLWRRIHRDDKDIFLSFLQAMMDVFPLEGQV